jgi:hypothetical protein
MSNPATHQIYELTVAGAHALATDDAVQIRLDRTALDEIAETLTHPGSPAATLDAIADLVRSTRRAIKADRTS